MPQKWPLGHSGPFGEALPPPKGPVAVATPAGCPHPRWTPRPSSPRGHLEQGPPNSKGKAAAISPRLPRPPYAEEETAAIFPFALPEGEAAILKAGRGPPFWKRARAAILEAGDSPLRPSRLAGPESTFFPLQFLLPPTTQ